MALILAVDPGGRQTAALALLARDLRGHELLAANSYAVALKAVDRHMPDLVLLPLLPEAGQTELLSRLRAGPNDVPTLTLPLLTSETYDPRSFVNEISESLAARSAPSPPETETPPSMNVPSSEAFPEGRANVIAAAHAAVSWIKGRRATWTDVTTPDDDDEVPTVLSPIAPSPPEHARQRRAELPALEDDALLPVAAATTPSGRPSSRWKTTGTADPLLEWTPPAEPDQPSQESRLAVGMRAWRESLVRWLPRVAALAVLVALAAAGRTYWPKLRATLTNGVAVLESVPAGSQVFVDGRLAGTTPITTELPAGPHTIEFRNGDLSRTTKVVVVARDRVVERLDWTAKPTGGLQVNSDPTGARVLVDGEFRGTTPLKLEGLPVGAHIVAVESSGGSVRRNVTIEAGQTAQVTELIFSGWLAVFSPFEIEVHHGTQAIRLDERGRVMLTPGPYNLRFQNRALGYDEVRLVEIKPADTTTLNLVPRTTLSVTATAPAEVWIDGARVGDTPLADLPVNVGTRVVVLKTAGGVERRFSVTATVKPVQLDVDFSKPQL